MIAHGAGLNFGVNSTIIGVNGLFQSRDHHYMMSKDEIKDGGETTVSVAYWDGKEEAIFIYVATNPGFLPSVSSNAIVSIPTISSFVQIIDIRYPRIQGFWICDDVQLSNSNTNAVRVTVKLSRYPNVLRF